MATYIQGVTDYIPQLQSFQPDLNFFGNVMQTRQSRYDSAKKKVSDLYGSLLYAPLTGEDNIKRRDEFFNFIDNDIRRISGLDLSLQQNQDAAMKVFDGFYADKDIMNDMAWTRGLNNAEQKHYALMNCFDPKECGGQGWETGGQELQFKREDFKNATAQERMRMQAPIYTPYYNWKDDAIKAAKAAGYSVTRDSLSGDYIVKDTNGSLITEGLYSVFKDAYGEDPRVEANYKTKSYVTRKVTSKNDASLYGSEAAAEREYLGVIINKGLTSMQKELDNNVSTLNSTEARINQLENEASSKGLSKEKQATLDAAYASKERLTNTQEYLQKNLNSIKANAENGDMDVLRNRGDNAQAQVYLQNDLKDLAKTLSVELNSGHEIKVNPLAEIKKKLQADIAMENLKYSHDLSKEEQKFEHDKVLKGMEISGKLPAQALTGPDYDLKQGVSGTNAGIGLEKDQSIGYEMNQEEWKQHNAQAQSSANVFNHEAFIAAKQAGATDYLDKLYGKGKWENVDVNDPEAFLKLTAGKNNIDLFNATLTHLKSNTLNVGWAEGLMMSQKKLVADTKLAEKAANGTLKFNVGVNKKIADEMKSQIAINPLYRYVDEMFYKTKSQQSVGSLLNNSNKGVAPPNFIKAYVDEHLHSTPKDAQKAYNTLSEDFYKRYNDAKNKDVSLSTGVTLGGTGQVSGNTLIATDINPIERSPNSANMLARDLMIKLINDDGNSYVGLGGNTKSTYEKAIGDEKANDLYKNILRDVVRDIDQSTSKTKDEKKHFYSIDVSAVGGENKDIASMQIRLDPDYIKSKAGKDNMISEAQAKELANTPITAFWDKNKIPTKLMSLTKDSNYQRILKTTGYDVMDDYADIATVGPLKTTYNKGKDLVSYELTLKERNLDGSWKPTVVKMQPTGIAEAQSQYDLIMRKLEIVKNNNLKMIEAEEQLNLSKK